MNQRILLVDDDDTVSQSLALALQSEGFEVECARSGRDGVRRFTAEPPALVLLDLHMPGKDGWHAFDLMEKFQPLVPGMWRSSSTRAGGSAVNRRTPSRPLRAHSTSKPSDCRASARDCETMSSSSTSRIR